jgi:DNA-binding transcriptional LysR family regulator
MMDIDFNLLRVFELLYEEGNVTRAAARLCLTQSAVSHALARLRIVLEDPLFVRIPSGLQPTERAHQLAPRLRVALAEIRSMVAAPVFDPATTSRRFTISAGSYFSTLIVRLITLARRSAPGVSIQIVNIGANLTQALDQQEIDLVLGGFDRIPARFRSEWLFQDELAWVIGPHHPPSEQPSDHEAFLTWPLVGIVSTPLGERSRERLTRDDILLHAILDVSDVAASPASARRGPPSLMVCDAPTAMAITAVTDMVALVPRRYAETCANSGQIRIVDLPRNRAETVDLSMLWHSRVHDDPGSQWLRSIMREAVKLHFEAAQPRDLPGNRGKYGGARMKIEKAAVRSRRDRNKVVVKLR